MRHFQPPPRRSRAAILPPTPLAAMSPGRYLQLRREAAGLSISDVADRLVALDDKLMREEAAALIRLLELPTAKARFRATLDRLRTIFTFDIAVYLQLTDEPADRHPKICRGCGCTQWDACSDEHGHTCFWAEPGLCSGCVEGATGPTRRRAAAPLAAGAQL
jgi:hypothetical protein